MRALIIFLAIIIPLIGAYFYLKPEEENIISSPIVSQTDSKISPVLDSVDNTLLTSEIAENLDTPWALAFLPDGNILVTERKGKISLVKLNSPSEIIEIASLKDVKEVGEGGLLGIVLHPDFINNHYLYLYYTYAQNGGDTLNRVVRMTYENDKLSQSKIIVDRIPGAANHNGGRIKYGPDNYLYITTGDGEQPSRAQDKNSLAGKILRVKDDGQKASGNPFNTSVYSYGHRNPQGLAWDLSGRLFSTEHGRSGLQSGLDELNLIEPGKNYGWPEIQGTEKQNGMETPLINSGSDTWAPAGAAFVGNILYFAGLRGSALYQAKIVGNDIQINELFKNEYGRLRDVVTGPDGMLYITTSNLDGRGNPNENDDKIIRVNPSLLP
ncbi:hypothetical protein A2W14_03095 [Candidatus Gottesmanbacteria bacterium RBG_16_37_8]|uniref:Glucose/Sorbosone dehydrogenase domain-containing protein n=1 Tax=Candidatus Gottesmanbacteria bacterium RBG_16_37_8 TaxID=1798371 RepID=A0A1F5YTY4_9BACT|nr:MAG: hypothetical protein A2W14_03095 [Candidatus Gottesmanbacteria bacterium RBG_16_37_8]